MTYDPGSDTVTTENRLTPDEQQSLKVGEELEAQQEGLLAGKYKDAAELEKAYVELSKKLGEKSDPDTEEPESEAETVDEESSEEEPAELSPAAELITSASEEFNTNDGKLSPETLDKFSSMSSRELVEAYMQVQGNLESNISAAEAADITQAAVNEVKNFAGGEKAYTDIVQWASNNLDQKSIDAFDSIINTGSVDAIKIAVSGLKAQYENANGYEGRMVTGKTAAPAKGDVFRSQQELVQAMSDKRYQKDPAYRQDIIAKLDRSGDLNF